MNGKPTILLVSSLMLNISCGVIAVYVCPLIGNPPRGQVVGTGPSAEKQTNRLSNDPTFVWAELESTDYPTYIANLRRVGCPEETVQDIIVAEISKLYDRRLAELSQREGLAIVARGARHENRSMLDPQRALFKEKSEVIKQLLGIDLESLNRANDTSFQRAKQCVSFLSDDKASLVLSWEDKYAEQEREIHSNANGVLTDADRAALSQLAQRKAAELNAILSPEEEFEYELRNSSIAQRLSADLGPVQPSDAEFRSLYKAQVQLQSELDAVGSLPAGGPQRAASSQAWSEYESELQSVLGDQRYAEYQRSKDPDYQTTLRIVGRYGMPPEIAGQVFDLKQSTEAQTDQIMANAQLSAGQQQAMVQGLRKQAQAGLLVLLGQQAFDVYFHGNGGWLGRN